MRLATLRSCALLLQVGERVKVGVEGGRSLEEVWNESLVRIGRLSHAHAAALLMGDFVEFVESDELGDGAEKDALRDLAALFGLMIVERNAGDFVSILGEEDIEAVRDEVFKVLKRVRANAIGLVDAFDFSDFRLKSVLGRWART